MVLAAVSIGVDIQGSVVGDTPTSPGDKWRYHISDALSGSSWNATNTFGDGNTIEALSWAQALTFSGNKSEATCSYLILQHRSADAVMIKITSIRIIYETISYKVAGVDQTTIAYGGHNTTVIPITDGYKIVQPYDRCR